MKTELPRENAENAKGLRVRVRRDLSQGPESLLALAEALAEYARGVEQFKDFAYAIWPRLRIQACAGYLQFVPSGERLRGLAEWFAVEPAARAEEGLNIEN